jgi:hypothetical protein
MKIEKEWRVKMPMTFKEFDEKMKDPEFRNRGAIKCNKCKEVLDAMDLQEMPRMLKGK